MTSEGWALFSMFLRSGYVKARPKWKDFPGQCPFSPPNRTLAGGAFIIKSKIFRIRTR